MRGALAMLVVAAGCSKGEPSASSSAPSAAPSAAPAFDVEGFCDETLAVGRPCEGDDELLEGNKIGLCTTTLREARDEGVTLDAALGPACVEAVKAGGPLPDLRTLETLVARFEPCRKLLAPIAALKKVAPGAAGSAGDGAACRLSDECAHGLYCAGEGEPDAGRCLPRKKAGASCRSSQECLGRCSAQAGKTCVAYFGSG
jgi:hypothetical protein